MSLVVDVHGSSTIAVPLALGGLARGITPEGEPPDPREILRIAIADNRRLTAENLSLRRDVRDLRRDLRHLGDCASMVSSITLSLARMLLDRVGADGPQEVVIPKWLHDRMLGASIKVGRELDGGIRVAVRDEGKARVVPIA